MAPPPPQDLRLPSIDGLRAFEAAARLGTFERAADELCVTASAVAKRVAAVEELLGTALFVRTGKALLPTAAARGYLPQVAEVLGLLAAMPLHRRPAPALQRLRLSAPPTFARQVLVPALDALSRAHPEIELEVALSVPDLEAPADTADLVVRHADPARRPGLRLTDDRLWPLAAPALRARLGTLPLAGAAVGAHTDAVAGHTAQAVDDWPLLRTPLEPWAPWFAAAGLQRPEPHQGPRLVDLGMTLEAAAAGQGVALARPTLARAWLASGALVPLSAISAQPATQYLLQPAEPAPGPAQAVAQWLQATCQRAQAEAEAEIRRALAAAGLDQPAT